jgi:hypothetical protein
VNAIIRPTLLVAALLLASTATGQTQAEPNPLSFADQVEARFAAWDANRDGYVSFLETSRLVPEVWLKGEEAAAVAAIHRIQRGRAWTRAAFSQPALVAPDAPSGPGKPGFEANYLDCLARIRATDRVLFPKGGPSLRAFHQGVLGDCYFVAVIGALVARDPAELNRVIRPGPDGAFDVIFPDRESVRVRHLSDAEIALGSSVGGQGLWLNVLEKAFGLMAEEAMQLQGGVRQDALDAVAAGGQSTRSLRVLTGREARSLYFREEGSSVGPTDAQAAELVQLAARALTDSVRLRRLVVCDSAFVETAPGVPPQHAYAVLGFDPKTGRVHVWNPWGDNFQPAGEPGISTGYAVRSGHFEVPLADFVRIFGTLHYETSIPARVRW